MSAVDPITTINTLFQTMQSVGSSLDGVLVSEGTDLAFKIAYIMSGWYLLQFLVNGGLPDLMASGLNLLMKGAVIAVMLQGWTTDTRILFVNDMEQVAQTVTGGNTDGTAVLQSVWTGIQEIFSGERSNAASPCETVPDVTADGQVLPGTDHSDCTPKAKSTWQAIKEFPFLILDTIAKAIAAIALLLMGLVFVLVVQMGSFMLNIAFCLGPILVPWLMFPPLEFLFNGWIKFTITAGLFKIVAWTLMTIVIRGALPSLQTMVTAIGVAQTSPDAATLASQYISMLAVAFVACVGAFMMWKAERIAESLVAGGGGGGAGGFGGGLIGGGMRAAASAPFKRQKKK